MRVSDFVPFLIVLHAVIRFTVILTVIIRVYLYMVCITFERVFCGIHSAQSVHHEV